MLCVGGETNYLAGRALRDRWVLVVVDYVCELALAGGCDGLLFWWVGWWQLLAKCSALLCFVGL